jgi:hypothetical protein
LKQTVVHRGRYNIKLVNLNRDISAMTPSTDFLCQIRATEDHTSELIAQWTLAFENTGSDGLLRLTLDDSITSLITHKRGFMDLLRIEGGQPISEFDEALPVEFRGMPSHA